MPGDELMIAKAKAASKGPAGFSTPTEQDSSNPACLGFFPDTLNHTAAPEIEKNF